MKFEKLDKYTCTSIPKVNSTFAIQVVQSAQILMTSLPNR